MNYLLPTRLDPLARDYALGLMSGGARRRFQRVLRDHAAAEQAVLAWQHRLAVLAAPVPPLEPRAEVWQRLEKVLNPAGKAATAGPRSASAWLARWFPARTLGGALAGVLLAVVVLRQQPAMLGLEPASETLPASYVGLLLDGAGKPALLASSLRQGRLLTLKVLQPISLPADRVALLWALPKDGGAPFKLGVVPTKGSATLPLPEPAEKLFFTVSRLAVTFESAATANAPGADFVLSGHCVKLW